MSCNSSRWFLCSIHVIIPCEPYFITRCPITQHNGSISCAAVPAAAVVLCDTADHLIIQAHQHQQPTGVAVKHLLDTPIGIQVSAQETEILS